MAREYKLLGKDLIAPIGVAAGAINGTSEERIRQEFDQAEPAGFVTIGSFTPKPQAGNEAQYGKVYHHDKETGTTWNSIGLANIGIDRAEMILPELQQKAEGRGQILIASVSPTIPTAEIGGPIRQSTEMVDKLIRLGIITKVNTACPNIVMPDGSRKPLLGYDAEGMEELIKALTAIVGQGNKILGIKLPPYLTPEQIALMPEIARWIRESGIFAFVVTSNTIPNQVPVDANGNNLLAVPGGAGGMSGPSTAEIGQNQLRMWLELLGGEVDFISALGVGTGAEAFRRIVMGANAAGAVTRLWENQNMRVALLGMLREFVDAEEAYA